MKGRRAGIGTWVYVPATGKLTCSKELLRIYGFDPAQGTPTNEEFDQRVHPEDRERHGEAVERAVRDNGAYVDDYRIILPDGTVRSIHETGRTAVNARGEVELVGTSTDVTGRKRTG